MHLQREPWVIPTHAHIVGRIHVQIFSNQPQCTEQSWRCIYFHSSFTHWIPSFLPVIKFKNNYHHQHKHLCFIAQTFVLNKSQRGMSFTKAISLNAYSKEAFPSISLLALGPQKRHCPQLSVKHFYEHQIKLKILWSGQSYIAAPRPDKSAIH